MSYQADFENADGWDAVDVAGKLHRPVAKAFVASLEARGVELVVRYYASTARPKTISAPEARFLSEKGFAILPVFQDVHRETKHFGAENGRRNAQSALDFAREVGQPAGTTIVFAADADFSEDEIEDAILPFFREVRTSFAGAYRVGAYGSGLVLDQLRAAGVIDVPWLSMSRGFRGTREFFYGNSWAFRQVPPSVTTEGVGHDRNVLKWSLTEIGAFRVAADGTGVAIAAVDEERDGVLGGVAFATPLGMAAGAVAAATTTAATSSANAYVTTEGLNFRDRPEGTILRSLTIGEPVADLGAADLPGWRNVRIGGTAGAVFGKYLRPPLAPEREALLAATITQWVRFDKGQAKEEDDPYSGYVGEMWQSIGKHFDGRSKYPDGKDVPWSAAFISFVVRRSGPAYAAFKFADAHSVFANDAIQARILGRRDRPFWGYRRTEAKPELGDIVLRFRSGVAVSFDYAENHERGYDSHSDVVVEVTPNVVRVIGGNVSDTVTLSDGIKEYKLQEGFIAPDQQVVALLKNRAAEVWPMV